MAYLAADFVFSMWFQIQGCPERCVASWKYRKEPRVFGFYSSNQMCLEHVRDAQDQIHLSVSADATTDVQQVHAFRLTGLIVDVDNRILPVILIISIWVAVQLVLLFLCAPTHRSQ